MAENRSYDLSREMITLVAEGCDPEKAVLQYAGALEGAEPGKRDQTAQSVFSDYGRKWADRTIEMGEKYVERTYEIIKEAAKKTGRLAFPHIPQRFIEIGYLATQPMEFLNIVVNNHYELIFRVDECATFSGLIDKCGSEVAGEMPCRHACISFCDSIFKAFNMNVDFAAESLRSKDGYCQFRAANKGN
ncbi:MAG: hypothetical protein ACOY46_12515 [Bacillota bacterium]